MTFISAEHTKKMLKLYRSILRERLSLPTENRRQFILLKTRNEFRLSKNETDPKKLKSLTIIGNTHLDTVIVQGKHLSSLIDREPTDFEKRNNIAHNYFEQLRKENGTNDETKDKRLFINPEILKKEKEKKSKQNKINEEDNIN